MPLLTKDFDYHLPEELIASRPLPQRSASRMLVVHKDSGLLEHRMFIDLCEYIQQDDLLVLNDTKVIPARVFSDDGKTELLCLVLNNLKVKRVEKLTNIVYGLLKIKIKHYFAHTISEKV